jgi:hypothetical protein
MKEARTREREREGDRRVGRVIYQHLCSFSSS